MYICLYSDVGLWLENFLLQMNEEIFFIAFLFYYKKKYDIT